jgi:hypothetical protein
MAEVLATALSGALPAMLSARERSRMQFAAYNISAFTVDRFKDTMDEISRRSVRPRRSGAGARPLHPSGLSEAEGLRLGAGSRHKEIPESPGWTPRISPPWTMR